MDMLQLFMQCVNIYRARKFALPGTHQIDLSWFFTCASAHNFIESIFFWDETFINNHKLWSNLVGFVLYLHLLKAKFQNQNWDYKSLS